MASSLLFRRQVSSSALRHQTSSLVLRYQVSRSVLKHQVWLTTHVKNHEDVIVLICLSGRSNRLGLSIPSSMVSSFERSVGLVCPFHLELWKNENFSLQVSDRAYLSLDEVIPNELYVCLGRPKGLESKKYTWREGSHNAP